MEQPFEAPVIEDQLQRRLLAYSRTVLSAQLGSAEARIAEARRFAELRADPNPVLRLPYGLFVTLRGPGQALRGCIGRIISSAPWIEIVAPVTREAAFEDHRFAPLPAAELDTITIEHSILTEPAPTAVDRLQLGRDGIILTVGGRRALFLPEVATEQRWNLNQTLTALARKAGLPADAWRAPNARLEFFRTFHYAEGRT